MAKILRLELVTDQLVRVFSGLLVPAADGTEVFEGSTGPLRFRVDSNPTDYEAYEREKTTTYTVPTTADLLAITSPASYGQIFDWTRDSPEWQEGQVMGFSNANSSILKVGESNFFKFAGNRVVEVILLEHGVCSIRFDEGLAQDREKGIFPKMRWGLRVPRKVMILNPPKYG